MLATTALSVLSLLPWWLNCHRWLYTHGQSDVPYGRTKVLSANAYALGTAAVIGQAARYYNGSLYLGAGTGYHMERFDKKQSRWHIFKTNTRDTFAKLVCRSLFSHLSLIIHSKKSDRQSSLALRPQMKTFCIFRCTYIPSFKSWLSV